MAISILHASRGRGKKSTKVGGMSDPTRAQERSVGIGGDEVLQRVTNERNSAAEMSIRITKASCARSSALSELSEQHRTYLLRFKLYECVSYAYVQPKIASLAVGTNLPLWMLSAVTLP